MNDHDLNWAQSARTGLQAAIFLFTRGFGSQFGYDDGWTDEGIYLYTGEGQVGDMRFVGGTLRCKQWNVQLLDLIKEKEQAVGSHSTGLLKA